MQRTATETKTETQTNLGQNKRAAFIIAFEDFRDEEYFVPKEILKKAGLEVVTVSTDRGKAKGADGATTEVDLLLENLEVDDFEVITFIGGPGALDHLDNENSYEIAKEAAKKDKLLSAICIAPVILAKAGVLEGKEATVWSSSMNKDSIETLEENGANYHDRAAVIDGNIVTAEGPQAARKFGEAIIHALTRI